MVTKSDLFKEVRSRLKYSQSQMANLLGFTRRATIWELENKPKMVTYQRLCQLYVVYIKLCNQDKKLDNIFNNYIEKMFKE